MEVKDDEGNLVEAVLELRYRRIHVLPPIGKQKQYPDLTLTVLYAQERGTPKDREKIDWRLITDLPVRSRAAAIEKLHWYALRWKIEVLHKVLTNRAATSRIRSFEPPSGA